MVYVTGDTHGELARFQSREMKALRAGDTLVVLGDFGFIWNGSEAEAQNLRWLAKRPYKILFLPGTHDNYDLLEQYPETSFQGGVARHIEGNLYMLSSGHIFDLEGKQVFCYGGGDSQDREERMDSGTWWPQELSTAEEMGAARKRLAEAAYGVDYICTHEPPAQTALFLDQSRSDPDGLETFFDTLTRATQFQRWFFGAMHRDKAVGSRFLAVFEQVHPLR